MTRSLSFFQAVLLGLVVLAGLGLGILGLLLIGGPYWPWNNTLHVRAGFANVHGVEAGTRVRVQGMDAGEVEALLPPEQPGGPVILRLRLKGDFRSRVRSDASAQIVSEGMVGGKVIEIMPGSAAAEPVADNALIATRPTADLNDVLSQVNGTLQGIREGQGTIGKLARDPEAYAALLSLLKQSEKTMASVQQDADALKRVPLVGGYVEDAQSLLVRPDCERNRRVFSETDLFEPGRSVLTAQGRQKLDEVAPWLAGFSHKGTELVIVSYADPNEANREQALTITRLRSEAVGNYLKDHYAVHKLGWFSSRKVTPLGMGTRQPPVPEKENLPATRTEVQVFVPQS